MTAHPRSGLQSTRPLCTRSRPSATRWLLGALLVVASASAAAGATQPGVVVEQGAVRAIAPREIDVWANSPRASIALLHTGIGFYRTAVRWFNVPVGSYVASPEGVADAASRNGGTLIQNVLVSGHSTARWQLEPNLKGGYAFAVSSGDPAGLSLVRRTGGVNFAFHLGNAHTPLPETLASLATFPFPTYVVPGNRDSHREYLARTGPVQRDFGIGRDRFVVLDNADGRVGRKQREWVQGRLQAFHAEGARRIYALLHWPLVDPRPAHRANMESRREVRALERVFKAGGVTAVFTGHIPIAAQTQLQGVNYYVVGPGHAVVVRSDGADLSIRTLP